MEERSSFVFYASFQTAAERLPTAEMKAAFYEAIALYGLKGEAPDFAGFPDMERNFLLMAMDNITPNIDAAARRRADNSANGRKGGNPNFKKGQRNPYYTGKKITQDKRNISETLARDNRRDNLDVDVDAESISTSTDTANTYSSDTSPEAGGGYPAPAPSKPLEEMTQEEINELGKRVLPTLI